MNPTFQTVVGATLLVTCSVAAVTDHRTGIIPNRVTVPALALGILAHGVALGVSGIGRALSGALLLMLVPWVLYRTSSGTAIGGGDLKLFGAIGALLGPTLGLEVELLAFSVVALCTMIRLTYRGRLFGVLGNSVRILLNPLLPAHCRRPIAHEELTALRMGPFILVAAAVVVGYDRWVGGPW